MLLLHQFQHQMIRNREQVVDRPGLATVLHSDGHGTRQTKVEGYTALAVQPPLHMGIKLFPPREGRLKKFTDTNLFSPREVLALTPQPEFISYQ